MIPMHVEHQRQARTDGPVEARQSTHQLLRTEAGRLSDVDLLRRVVALAGRERASTVELVAHLAELDILKLYRGEGYGSLFTYCTDSVRLSGTLRMSALKPLVRVASSRGSWTCWRLAR
jgi:hypothetical protein